MAIELTGWKDVHAARSRETGWVSMLSAFEVRNIQEYTTLYYTENPGIHYKKGNKFSLSVPRQMRPADHCPGAIELTDYGPRHREVGGIDRR